MDDLKLINYKTSETFLKYLDNHMRFGYIQTSLKDGVKVIAVSNYPEKTLSKLELIGIKKENAYVFHTLYELRDYLSIKVKNCELEFFKDVWNILDKILRSK